MYQSVLNENEIIIFQSSLFLARKFEKQVNNEEEKMASQGIRGTTLTMAGSNIENQVGMGPGAAKGRVTRAKRTAMTDIGNKANLLQNAKNLNIKKEAVKPGKALSKQKATTSLTQLATKEVAPTRVTRRSAESKKEKSIEGEYICLK